MGMVATGYAHLSFNPTFFFDAAIQNSVAGIVGSVNAMFTKPKKTEQHELIKRLAQIGKSGDELANAVLALMVASTVELSLGV